MKANPSERQFYPEIEPFNSGMLKVSELHNVYFEESGSKNGLPVVFLHGGPGGGTSPMHRRFFNPQKYRAVLFDQRGCGKSTPFAELRENTTWDLVADIEKLRQHLGIEKWVVFGGSWGSTLALAYAQAHPQRVAHLVLRGIFLCRRSELEWTYQFGSSELFPEYWQTYHDFIPANERGDFMKAYYKRLTGPDEDLRLKAAQVWSQWEAVTSHLYIDHEAVNEFEDPRKALPFARIEAHYFVNGGFLKSDDQLLQVEKIRHIPCNIVQGRYDVVCPARSAYDLHERWPESRLEIIADAGHSAFEPGIRSALIRICDEIVGK